MFDIGLNKDQLVAIAQTRMPFGKYKNRPLLDLPEEYLLWMSRKGFPSGPLGTLLALTLELKTQGIDYVLQPLKTNTEHHPGSDQLQ